MATHTAPFVWHPSDFPPSPTAPHIRVQPPPQLQSLSRSTFASFLPRRGAALLRHMSTRSSLNTLNSRGRPSYKKTIGSAWLYPYQRPITVGALVPEGGPPGPVIGGTQSQCSARNSSRIALYFARAFSMMLIAAYAGRISST